MPKVYATSAVLVFVVVAALVGGQFSSAHPSPRQAGAGIGAQVSCASGAVEVQLGQVRRLSPPGSGVSWPDVVVDAAGRATAAFGVRTESPSAAALWSADLPASTGDPRLVRSSDVGWPGLSDGDQIRNLGIDDAGTQTLAWAEEVLVDGEFTESYHVMVATRPLNGDWSAPIALNPTAAFVTNVHLAVSGAGAAVVTWVRGVDRLFASYRAADGSTWTQPQQLVRRGAYFNEVGIDDSGRAMVVYDVDGVQVRRFHPATGWGPARALGSRRAYGSNLAVSPNGSAAVTWEEPLPGGGTRHLSRSMTPAGDWQAAARRLGGLRVSDEGLAIDGRGIAVAAWWNRHDKVVVQFSRRDGSWRRPRVLTDVQRGPDEQSVVKVAANGRGDTLVVWKAKVGDDQRLRGRYRVKREGWAPVRRLTPVGVHANIYATSIGPGGEAVVAWMRGRRVEGRQIIPCPLSEGSGGRW